MSIPNQCCFSSCFSQAARFSHPPFFWQFITFLQHVTPSYILQPLLLLLLLSTLHPMTNQALFEFLWAVAWEGILLVFGMVTISLCIQNQKKKKKTKQILCLSQSKNSKIQPEVRKQILQCQELSGLTSKKNREGTTFRHLFSSLHFSAFF